MKYILVLVIALIAALFFFNKTSTPKNTVTINNHVFTVEIAVSDEERVKGLSGRNELLENHGMLFVFNKPNVYTFWMKDTLIPLDMIFINNDQIVTIHKNVQPQPNATDEELQRYSPKEPVNYVLEISGGLSEKYGFKEGDTVRADFGN